MKKPSDRTSKGLPITHGAIRRIGSGHPLRRDPARVTHNNMCIWKVSSKQDISISLRIGHFYFAATERTFLEILPEDGERCSSGSHWDHMQAVAGVRLDVVDSGRAVRFRTDVLRSLSSLP